MYIMFIVLLAVVALSAYVGWSVQNNRLDSAWWVTSRADGTGAGHTSWGWQLQCK
jgi:hypothetical protein